MNIQSAISREIFVPRDEKLLVAIEVRRRMKKKGLSFLNAGRKRDYLTYLCLSVTNSRPAQVLITKVKRYRGTRPFAKRSQWSVEQLRQVNGINPDKDTPEFDLVFNRTTDQWVASSAAEKCMFVQVLYHACQNYWEAKLAQANTASPRDQKIPGALENKKSPGAPSQTSFVNCQQKLMGDSCSVNMVIYRCKIFLNRMKNSMTANQGQPRREAAAVKASRSSPSPPAVRKMGNVMRRASQVLSERGERLMRADDKTSHFLHGAKQFAEAAQKLALKQI
ncbi:syntaxin-binding protein 6-like [Sinocyclocheilus rhinocerous]|uniref:Syntaxin-binding protein 6-like n=1 Tax=Sinocyclocheilus rhinocerous TaxID=307959 RepID=A0A673HE30_9TELE|nr:PREDICTED: syntaxin-binding protein 6-like [Sinocyclocheilus rhinocerous]XP_016373185.1 PREDICTED: syntaxin-binding protein 6-like [Sinocyclocheilus rhinocerous]